MQTHTFLSARRIYAGVMLAGMIDQMAMGILMPVIPLLALQLGANAFQVAAVVAAQFVAGAVMSPVLGWLGDRLPRSPLVLIALAGLALSYWLLPLAKTLSALFALRILTGLMITNFVLLESVISNITTDENRSVGHAKLRLGSTVGLIVGPSIANVLIGLQLVDGIQGLLSLAAVLATIQPVIMAWALRGQLTRTQAKAREARAVSQLRAFKIFCGNARIRDFAIVKALIATCFAVLTSLAPVVAVRQLGWGTMELSQLVATFGVALLVVQLSIAAGAAAWLLNDRALFIACLLVIPGFLLLMKTPSPFSMFACYALLGLGSAVVNIAVPTAISRMEPVNVGFMLGMTSTAVFTGSTVGPIVMGLVYEAGGPQPVWSGGALLAFTAAVLAWRHLKHAREMAQALNDG